jgi:hypothetical protein
MDPIKTGNPKNQESKIKPVLSNVEVQISNTRHKITNRSRRTLLFGVSLFWGLGFVGNLFFAICDFSSAVT